MLQACAKHENVINLHEFGTTEFFMVTYFK